MYKESLPFHDKAVGEKQQFQRHFEAWITQRSFQKGEKIPDLELEKTPEEEALIRFSETAARDYVKRYAKDLTGRPDYPSSFIHVLPSNAVEDYTKGKLATAGHSTINQNILIERTESKIDFTLNLFHELIHGYAYTAVQRTTNDTFEPYRAGFSIYSRDGEKKYFKSINEGIVGLITERFFNEYIKNNPIFNDELAQRLEKIDTSREEEKIRLQSLIDDLWKKNKDSFRVRVDIENLFIDAEINGHLLPVARLIEKTYGKGSFRKIGEESEPPKSK